MTPQVLGDPAMRTRFAYDQPRQRVVFGPGALAGVAEELAALDSKAAFLIADPETPGAEAARSTLGPAVAASWAQIEPHVPVEQVGAARQTAREHGVDALVAVGGGSTIGLAKALAQELELPILAVPTTYAGSEMTPIFGTSEGLIKTTGRDERVRPRTVIYDPELTLGLPPQVTAGSGLNALAHCIEGMYPERPAPVVEACAAAGIRALIAGLPRACADGQDLEGRSACLRGAYLAGIAISAGVALHHKLCHAIGGASRAAHGDINAVVLPHAAAYNLPEAPQVAAILRDALDTDEPAGALFDFAQRLGAPTSLEQVGVGADTLEGIAEATVTSPFHNPRAVTRDGVLALLQAAFAGQRPQAGA